MSNNTYNAVQTPAGLLAEDAEAPYSEGLVQDILRDGSASHPLTGQVLTTADLPDALRGGTANGCT